MVGKGEALNERVWKVFERAGFVTHPNGNDPSEVEVKLGTRKRTLDLVAEDQSLGIKIIGSNKSRKRLDGSFTSHVHDWEKLQEAAGADSVLFVDIESDPRPDNRAYAEEKGMRVWFEEDLRYFEVLVDTIGHYAKYEIIHYFGITTKEEKHVNNVLALHFRQPFSDSAADLYVFTLSPEILLKTCVVLRKAQGSQYAYQRILQKKRLAKLRSFVTQSEALLPPAIIVQLSDDIVVHELATPDRFKTQKKITWARAKNSDLVVLGLPSTFASMELIDGQHRLFGFIHTEPATRKNFNLVVVGIADLPPQRRTDTFIAINDNARRMDANLVSYLKYVDDEASCQANNELMAIKVAVTLNRTEPFKKRIRLLDIGTQRITLKGFAGYDLKGLLGVRGLLRQHYKNDSKEYVNVLRQCFGILKQTFPKQWGDPNTYIVFTNRGVSAFLKLLKSILKNHQATLTETVIRRYIAPLAGWKDSEWEIKKLKSKYVGSQGWKQFHFDLVESIRSAIPDFEA